VTFRDHNPPGRKDSDLADQPQHPRDPSFSIRGVQEYNLEPAFRASELAHGSNGVPLPHLSVMTKRFLCQLEPNRGGQLRLTFYETDARGIPAQRFDP